MTNWEKYKDDEEFQKICICGDFAIQKIDNKPVLCNDFDCKKCIFKQMDGSCYTLRKQWIDEEYQELKEPDVDWKNVKVDTPILVSDNKKDWYNRYFSKYYNGSVWTFNDGKTSWTCSEQNIMCWNYAKLAEVNKDD